MYVTARRSAGAVELELTGHWRVSRFADIDRELSQADVGGARAITISTDRLAALDFSSGWRLREFIEQARRAGAQVTFIGEPPEQLRLVDASVGGAPPAAALAPAGERLAMELPVEALGRRVVRGLRDTVSGLAFLGRLTVTLAGSLGRLRRLRPAAVARHVYDTGITAIPIVSLIAFLVSVIVAYLSAQQLQRFGAQLFVVDLITIGVLRELGVLLTAIIVAGRSGSSFAAEIGSMRLNEEIDALDAMGVDALETLALPRLLGLTLALPLLTIIADAIGLAGGAILCRYLLDIPFPQYFARVNDAIAPTTFWVGLVKAPVFAILIGLAGTYRGMQVRGSSRELGRLTTVAVVQAIFLVILADALLAVLFMELGI